MPEPLLATKLNIPPLRPQRIFRPRLVRKLEAGLEQSSLLTLVCAPAGYGKTTLLSEWLEAIAEKEDETHIGFTGGAWLALDNGDDDLAGFLKYLVAALRKVQPGIGSGLLTALQASRPTSGQVLATLLINDLAEISGRILLVLDDYHLIVAQPIHDFLSFLIEHGPPQLCLVIACRADPPLPLARWRARGQLAEVRQEDLIFTPGESAEFLEELGITLTSEQLQALQARTEGWAAGLQLAALSMPRPTDIPAFIEAFSGGQEHIADYLTDEVLAQQPEPVLSFLLQTSILKQMTAPLCEAVTGQAKAQETLDHLVGANLFLVPLDQKRQWYRYHTLFSDLLRRRLLTAHGEQVEGLHRRASRWYQENGFHSEAIEHALAGKDFEPAAILIGQLAEDGLAHGETGSLLRWLEALPAEIKNRYPIQWVFQDLALIMSGQPDAPVQNAMDALSESGGATPVEGEMATLQALRALMEGKATEAASLSQKAMRQLPPDRQFFRLLSADCLGMAHTLRGDSAAAIQAFEQVVDLAGQAGNDMMVILARSNVAGLQTLRGQLRASAATYQHVLEISEERFGKHSLYTGKTSLGLGELEREWNHLDSALGYFLESIDVLGKFSEIGLTVSYLSIARVKLAQGNWEAAQEYISKARLQARQSKTTQIDDLLTDLTQSLYWIRRGELDQALQWARSRGLLDRPGEAAPGSHDQGAPVSELVHGQILILVRLLLALQRPDDALQALQPLLANSLENGHNRRGIEYLILKALALQQKRAIDQALEAFGEALRLGEADNFQRMFLDEGKPAAQLLYLAAERGISPAYAGRLLSGFSSEELDARARAARAGPAEDLIEPLSEREREVLALIADGLSNGEIASRLSISLSTVKGHIANIFGKLGVRSRTQAVSRAQDLGLLAEGQVKHPLDTK